MDEIVNKVASSGLVSVDIKDYYPKGIRKTIDLKEHLFQELVLREKDFRSWCKYNDWGQFENMHVGVFCSSEAIIPTWAYMLVASYLEGIAETVHFGDLDSLEEQLVTSHIQGLDFSELTDKRVIVKGCSEINKPELAFLKLTMRLKPIVKSLMFGEACSSVPIYKKR